uniref:Male accessory gland secretory protein n=1 Tax=Caenorhabditis tropicalis TaxID=1561998 RepID=A0A1I7UJE4_9PELO
MRLLFLFFLVVAFTSAYVRKDNPFETANKIQAQLNSNVQSNNRWGVMSMMKNDFNYQDCNGKNYNSSESLIP